MTLAGALAVFLLAVGLAACGGGGGSSSGEEGSESSSRKGEAAKFTPKQHSDSGGGSKQFIQKGGDNSVQEFGEEAGKGEFEAAASAVHDFLDARAAGDWAAACEYMSKSITESFAKLAAGAKQLKGAGCAGILEKLTNPAARTAQKAEAGKADVGALRVEGSHAFVLYRGPKGAVLAMPMVEEDGAWKVASLAGTPLN